MKKALKILLIFFIICMVSVLIFSFIISRPKVQTYLVKQAASFIENQTGAKADIKKVNLRFPFKLILEDVFIGDLNNDTLLYTRSLKVNVKMRSFVRRKFDVKALLLDDAKLFLHRSENDELFNYQHLFGKSSSSPTTDDSRPFHLRLPEAQITNLDFHLLDEFNERELKIAFNEMQMAGLEIQARKQKISMDELFLKNANVLVKKFVETECEPIQEEKKRKYPLMLNPGDWQVMAGKIKIQNSKFENINDNKRYARGGMDYNDLAISKINLELENTQIICDTIHSVIKFLSAEEKSGFKITDMSAKATVSTTEILCEDLKLITENSAITDYIHFSYNSFRDFLDFVNKVEMEGDFKRSMLSMKDINYFARNALEKIEHNKLFLTGNIRGTVENLKGRELSIQMADATRFKGDLSMKGLPAFNETFITLKVDEIFSSAKDIKNIYPHLAYPANLERLGRINLSGAFTGFINDFVAYGNLNSMIGSVRSDVNFKIDPETGNARYSGNFAAHNFDVGNYFDQADLFGKITFNAHMEGQGLKIATMDANVDGVIDSIYVKQHLYKDVNIDGSLKNKFFSGSLAVRDDDLDLDFYGKIDLNEEMPLFEFDAELKKANIGNLNITKDSISLISKLKLDFRGKDLDNFVGYAGIFDTRIERRNHEYQMDTFELRAYPLGDNRKHLSLHSDVADAELTGSFSYQQLPEALKGLIKYYFNESQPLADISDKQDFEFNFRFKDTRNITSLIDSSIKNIGSGYVKGSFDNTAYKIDLDAWINSFTYKNLTFKEIIATTESNENNLVFKASIDSVFTNDSSFLEKIEVNAGVKPDSILFNIKVEPDVSPNRVRLNGWMQPDFTAIDLRLLPSEIYINDSLWLISENNNIYYDSSQLTIENLILKGNLGQVKLSAGKDSEGKNSVTAFLSSIDLNDLSTAFLKDSKVRFDGQINGAITLLDIFNKPKTIATLAIDTFSINKNTLGTLALKSDYSPGDEKAKIKLSLNGRSNNVTATGFYNLKKEEDYLDIVWEIENLHLPHIEPFVQKDVSKIQGEISGKLAMTGTLAEPKYKGKLTARNVTSKINFLNTTYSFKEEELLFKDQTIDLGLMEINDEEGNLALASGKIYLKGFKSVEFDVEINTDNFLFVNTSQASTQPFFGKLLASGLVVIKGPFSNAEFYASIRTMKNTNLYIDVLSSKDVSEYSFYRFINKNDKASVHKKYITRIKGISLNCDVETTPDATFNLILNYEQGDIIKGEGMGNLKVLLNPYGELSINGNYKITDGNYTFSMQNIISKKFVMDDGSSIFWNGDPADAILDISAIYKLRASPYDLIEDIVTGETELQKARNRVQVFLYLYVTGNLDNPEIRFDIKVPDADPAIRTALESKFQQLKYNPNEFNRQVVGLLVLNRFLRQGSPTDPNVASDVNNSVSEFISNQLSMYLSDWISEFVTDVQVDINYRTYKSEINGNGGTPDEQIDFENRQELQLALNKSFFNDRISVDVGGNFDFGENNAAEQNRATNVAGDFQIEYSIVPDGRIKVKAFRKGEYDIFQDRNKNKTGVGISYQREFNTLKDLFSKENPVSHIRKKREAEAVKEKRQQLSPPRESNTDM